MAQPNFANLKPISSPTANQPNFSTLQPSSSPQTPSPDLSGGDNSANNISMITAKLHQLITSGVPANNLQRLQLVNYLKTNQPSQSGTTTASQIIPGTKDALGDIFVKPEQKLLADAGTRIAQAGVQTYNEFQNTGYDTPAPTLGTKLNGGNVAPTPTTTNTSNSETNIQKPQQKLGVTVQPQQQGTAGASQIAEQGLNAATAVGNVSMAGELMSKTPGVVSDISNKLDNALTPKMSDQSLQNLSQGVKPTYNPDVEDIKDAISPKLTTKETRLALSEERLIPGQDPTLLKNGTPDTVIPSGKIDQAAHTIQEQIPDAAKMSQPKLFDAINKNGLAIRDSLTPVMQQTPVNSDAIQSINDSWKALKETQNNDEYLSTNTNLPKLQNAFETKFLSKVQNAQNMNDVWEATQAYDSSVPIRVKAANSMSSEVLQDQKAIWLQNRSILTDATHNISTGLDTTSQKAFSDMSNMYTAKENILSKIKVDKTGGLSKVAQWIKDNPWKAAVGAYVGNKTAKTLGLPSVPLP